MWEVCELMWVCLGSSCRRNVQLLDIPQSCKFTPPLCLTALVTQVLLKGLGRKLWINLCINWIMEKSVRLDKGMRPDFLKVGSVWAFSLSPPIILIAIFVYWPDLKAIFCCNNSRFELHEQDNSELKKERAFMIFLKEWFPCKYIQFLGYLWENFYSWYWNLREGSK